MQHQNTYRQANPIKECVDIWLCVPYQMRMYSLELLQPILENDVYNDSLILPRGKGRWRHYFQTGFLHIQICICGGGGVQAKGRERIRNNKRKFESPQMARLETRQEQKYKTSLGSESHACMEGRTAQLGHSFSIGASVWVCLVDKGFFLKNNVPNNSH